MTATTPDRPTTPHEPGGATAPGMAPVPPQPDPDGPDPDGDSPPPPQADRLHGIAFTVLHQPLMMPVAACNEIVGYPRVTAVPGAETWIHGVANHGGFLLTIVDLQGLLNGTRTTPDDRTRMLLRNRDGMALGFVVPEVLGIRNYEPLQHREPPPQLPACMEGLLCEWVEAESGFCAMIDFDRLVTIPAFVATVHKHGPQKYDQDP